VEQADATSRTDPPGDSGPVATAGQPVHAGSLAAADAVPQAGQVRLRPVAPSKGGRGRADAFPTPRGGEPGAVATAVSVMAPVAPDRVVVAGDPDTAGDAVVAGNGVAAGDRGGDGRAPARRTGRLVLVTVLVLIVLVAGAAAALTMLRPF
jgi:hypothetical protein